MTYHFPKFFHEAIAEASNDDYARLRLGGTLVTLGDALAAHNYFDRAPVLEMIRHLRNAVAHGNRFEIRDPEKLLKYPAHTRAIDLPDGAVYEITPGLHGKPCLFDYIDDVDVLSLLLGVRNHLLRDAPIEAEEADLADDE